jgi:hypothetical protein
MFGVTMNEPASACGPGVSTTNWPKLLDGLRVTSDARVLALVGA